MWTQSDESGRSDFLEKRVWGSARSFLRRSSSLTIGLATEAPVSFARAARCAAITCFAAA